VKTKAKKPTNGQQKNGKEALLKDRQVLCTTTATANCQLGKKGLLAFA